MTFLLAVLGASLIGSVHCAAMCGGFACVYAGNGHTRQHVAAPLIAYNGGRLVSYLLLGAIAGSLGHGIERVGAMAGVARLAAMIAGGLMVIWGAAALLAALGVPMTQRVAPRRLQAIMTSALVRFRNRPPVIRAAVTGLLTTLLPCGWLYVFVATAGGTGRVVDAMLVMVVFWLGTLPMMVTVGLTAQRLFGAFQRRLPLVSAVAAVVLGLLSIAGKMTASPIVPVSHTRHPIEVARDHR